ncbi:TonB-dependent receptor [Ferruginibacter paludis]|uniref:TonB-dependent receptor domain-containing protein n=1 Tax=Ferruginibacter paludis TaxID=1310417 RepID=UPI0025B40244|nr:TonB-dependent receptor [Ferruginibacter paludis]MDN3656738.1 TonB-dependent receptor [Ferruginibacter paludis]
MKKLPIIFITFILAIKSIGQTNETSVSGSTLDTKNIPVESATASLLKSKDSSIIKIAVSDKEGKFSFTGIPFGSYFITITTVSFAKTNSPAFMISENNSTVRLGTLILQELPKKLAAVVITGKKQLIEQKIDRMIVNVDASVTNVGSTALEVLEKSPGVTVDKDGNISLKGKSSVMVMIDGKPSYLSSAELANLLGNMNSNQLSQIEIMTNPSAKYDAAGNAGVINIKTKKSLTQGFNGSVTLSYGQGVYTKSNNSIALNYRTSKINSFLNYGYSINKGFMDFDIQRNFLGTTGTKISELDQQANRINQSQNNNLKLGLDYFINKQTTVGIATTGFIAPQKQDGFTTSYLKDGNENINSIEKTTRTVDNTWKNGTININFHSSFDSSKKDLTANFDYLHYDFSGNQNITGLNYAPNQILQTSNYLKNLLPLTIDIYSGRLDYAQPLNIGVKLEAGIKSSLVKTNNVSDFFNLSNNYWLTDSVFSNAFNYSENINAAYLNLNKKMDKWIVQAGLRLENTNYKGLQSSLSQKSDSSFTRSYTSLFPTAFISYEMNDNNQFAVSIGRRIDRPAYQELNPFIGFIDKYTYSTGNPFLQPQFSTNIELSHSYKNLLTTTVNYSVVHDMINETLVHKDSVIIRSVGNIGTRYNYGVTESATIPVSKWYSATLFANLYQNKYIGEINGYPFNAKQLTLSLNLNNQFSFAKGWSAELSGNYTSRNRDEGQAIVLPAGQLSAGISKQLLNNKASIKFNVRDIFYTQNPKEIQNFQDVQSTLKISRDTRVFNIAFVYRFGASLRSKPASSSPTDEQQRVKLN